MTAQRCGELFEELAGGRASALADIYELAGKQMFFAAYNVLQDYHLAQDALQEGLLHIYNNASTVRDYKSSLKWMLTVIRNAAIGILRKRKKEDVSDEVERHVDDVALKNGTDTYVSVSAVENDTGMTDSMSDALSRLEENSRQIVIFKAVYGYSHKEIASILGISVLSCQKKYQRALKQLDLYLAH